MHIPNPYTDPLFAVHMAVMFPFYSAFMLPTYVAVSADIARASMLAPVCAATAWNAAVLSLLAGNECTGDKARKPA